MTTKILALTDALGNLVRFVLMPGQRYDTVGVAPLIEGVEFGALIADKAFDANWIIAVLDQRGAGIVISQRPNRVNPLAIDLECYKWRHLIENFLQWIKEFRRMTDASFAAATYQGPCQLCLARCDELPRVVSQNVKTASAAL